MAQRDLDESDVLAIISSPDSVERQETVTEYWKVVRGINRGVVVSHAGIVITVMDERKPK